MTSDTAAGLGKIIRVIIVARLSRDKKYTTSVDTQLAEQRAYYASRPNYKIVAEVTDLEESGGDPIRKRAEISKWFDPIRMVEWDAISGYSIDRLFRNLYDFITFYHDFLVPNKKLLVITSEKIDMSTPDGRTMAYMRVVMAQNELDKITERNKRAAKAVLEQGHWRGGPIRFGWMRQREGDHWTLVPHPEHAQILREIADGIIAGMPVAAAARELTTRQIPTGRKRKGVPITTWHTHPLTEMLRSPTLAGYIVWQNKFTKGQKSGKNRSYRLVRDADGKPIRREPAILDQETFAKLQRALKRPTQKRGRVLTTARLINVAYCGECKQPLWSTKFTSKGKPYAYYVCSIRCGAKKIPQDALHERVDAMVDAIGHGPNRTPKVIPGKNYEDELAENKAQLQELDPDDLDYYKAEQARLLAERQRLQSLESEPDRVVLVEDGRTVADVYADDKRAWLLKHQWKIWAHKDAEGELVVTGGGGELFTDMGITFEPAGES